MSGNRWRAEVARSGVRKSKVFDNKQAAKDWAARQEYLILHGPREGEMAVFSDVMQRYANEVSPTKRGERWEILRLRRFQAEPIAKKAISDLQPLDFAKWRDARLKEVAPGTVNREMTLLSAVMTVARKEWGLIDKNPLTDVRKPTKPPARDRRVMASEIAAIQKVAGDDLTRIPARAFHAFLFAIETTMRAGEIVGLTWDRVDISQRYVTLPKTKNGTARDIPLSTEAIRLLEALPRADPVFGIDSAQLDVHWRKIRDAAKVRDLKFHDSRHEAITRLARKLEVLDLARMVGHRNISELLTYYNATASDIASRLD